MNPMEKALAGRKDKILTITISAGDDSEPAVAVEGTPQEEAMETPVMEAAEPMDEAKDAADLKDQMMGAMSDTDKEDLKNRKPRSLMERAQQAALKK